MKQDLSEILQEYITEVNHHNTQLGEELTFQNGAQVSFEGFALWLDTGLVRPEEV